MVMALIVLLGFGLLFMFAFDEGLQGDEVSIEAYIAQQAKEIDGAKARIDSGQKQLGLAPARTSKSKELANLKSKNQGSKGAIENLKKEVETASTELALLGKDFEGYKNDYRTFVRGKAKGEVMAKLETRGGVVFEDVSIREVTAVGIQIRHSGGQNRIAYEDLPASMQDHFQFDAAQKAELIAAEANERNKHDSAVAVTDEQQKKLMESTRAKEAEAAKIKAANTLATKSAQAEALETRIEEMEEAITLEAKKTVSRAGIMTVELAGMRRQLAELRTQIATLRGLL